MGEDDHDGASGGIWWCGRGRRPGPPQEPHPHHLAPARPRHHDDPGPRTAAPDEKGSVNDPKIGSS